MEMSSEVIQRLHIQNKFNISTEQVVSPVHCYYQ